MEANKTKNTCDERIDDELKSRLEEFLPDVESWGVLQCARYLKAGGREIPTAEIGGLRQEVHALVAERAWESILSVEKLITYKLCLSWGGPADYFELDWSPEASAWVGGRYIFQDWFDGASRPLSHELAEQLAELLGIYPDGQ